MKISLILLAAGLGSRMNLGYNKMFYKIGNETVIEKCLSCFKDNDFINEIIVVINKADEKPLKELLNDASLKYVYGGQERYDSVYNGLNQVSNEYVLIHDGARCFLDEQSLANIIEATLKYDSACLVVKAKDTIHLADNDLYLNTTLNRHNTYLAQTPQGFKTSLIKDVYHKFFADKSILTYLTDDAMLVNELSDTRVKLVAGSYANIKVTTIEDTKND